MIEVFKTNVYKAEESNAIIKKLSASFPEYKINFDLQDCDKILRIENQHISIDKIINDLNEWGYQCETLS